MKTVKEIKKELKKKSVKVKLKRKHFKKELSTSMGFGFQDLKKGPRKLISQLAGEGFKLEFIPKDMSEMRVDVIVKK